jgi:hypothetical protein
MVLKYTEEGLTGYSCFSHWEGDGLSCGVAEKYGNGCYGRTLRFFGNGNFLFAHGTCAELGFTATLLFGNKSIWAD